MLVFVLSDSTPGETATNLDIELLWLAEKPLSGVQTFPIIVHLAIFVPTITNYLTNYVGNRLYILSQLVTGL